MKHIILFLSIIIISNTAMSNDVDNYILKSGIAFCDTHIAPEQYEQFLDDGYNSFNNFHDFKMWYCSGDGSFFEGGDYDTYYDSMKEVIEYNVSKNNVYILEGGVK